MSHPDFHDLDFKRVGGLYLCDFPAEWHNPDDDLDLPLPTPRMTAYPTITVHDSDVSKHFSLQEIDRANGVGRFRKALSHPNDRFLDVMLDHGALADVDYTSKDLAGLCKACLMGKAKHLCRAILFPRCRWTNETTSFPSNRGQDTCWSTG